MNNDELTPPRERPPETQPAFSGGPPHPPPKPPKITARDLLDPGDARRKVFVPSRIEIKELAALLELKPFKIVADVLELGIFKHADELLDFKIAAAVATKHGFVAERIF